MGSFEYLEFFNDYLQTMNSARVKIGLVYLLCWSLAGLLRIALLESLSDLATAAGSTTATASDALYFKGISALLTSTTSSILYRHVSTNTVLSVVMLSYSCLFVLLAFNSSLTMLFVYYFLFGCLEILLDTSAAVRLMILFDKDAGPWIGGGQQIAACLVAAVAALIKIASTSVKCEFIIFSCFPLLCLIFLKVIEPLSVEICTFSSQTELHSVAHIDIKAVEENSNDKDHLSEETHLLSVSDSASSLGENDFDQKTDYYSVVFIAIMFTVYTECAGFFVAFISVYTEDVDAIASDDVDYVPEVYFVAALISKLFLLYNQLYFVNMKNLPAQIFSVSLISAVTMLLMILFPKSGVILWIAVSIIGFFGTCIPPLLLDLLNRITNASPMSD